MGRSSAGGDLVPGLEAHDMGVDKRYTPSDCATQVQGSRLTQLMHEAVSDESSPQGVRGER